MLDLLTGFVGELRAAGIPVSLSEHLDAAETLKHVPLEDREAIKYTLGASLVKSSTHWPAYETAFEIYFSLRGPGYTIADEDEEAGADAEADDEASSQPGQGGRQGKGRGGGGGEGMTPEELADMLYKALLERQQLDDPGRGPPGGSRYGGMEAGRPVGGTYYLYRTLRNLDLDKVLERLIDQARQAPRPRTPATPPGPT